MLLYFWCGQPLGALGAWDSCNRIFLYTTLNHVKYCLANGDTGIIRTLDVPVYITKAHQKQLYCLDREYKIRIISVDNTEALFKLALEDKNYPEVMNMIKHSRLCGRAIIAYLQDKGFPEVALHFVDDLNTRFKLALACGNIEVAMNTAYEIGDDRCWHQLGVEALRQGNHQTRKPTTGAEIDPGAGETLGRLENLKGIADMTLPDILQRPAGDQIDLRVPLVQERNVVLQPLECFT